MLLRYVCLVSILAQIVAPAHAAEEPNNGGDGQRYHQAAYREYFYVGGEYVTGASGESLMKNQMYVERLSTGRKPKHPYPLVLIHGNGMSGANTWLNTPNGRPGWASYFLSRGYGVYIIDQPTRGRSAWLPGDFAMDTFSAELLSQRFTATAYYNLWPQSVNHTQWPGNGTRGDPIYDAFYKSILQFLSNNTEVQIKSRDAIVALLDLIGPAVLMTHSQSGPFGWLVADARPHLVKAIVAVEPMGPTFTEAVFRVIPTRAWGLTDISMIFKPAASSPDQITKIRVPSNESNLVDCILQAEPARTLPNLKHIPVVIVTAEASYHAAYDHCSVQFLRQAGVPVDFLRLENINLHGNGHLMMLEDNNLDVAEALHSWIQKNTAVS